MSAGRPVNKDNLSAREEAVRELERYPFPDKRQAVAFALVRFIANDTRMVWASALRIAHRAGVSEDTAQRVLEEFDRTGLTVRVDDFECPREADEDRRGGSVARRIDIDRLSELYPGNVEWTEHRTRRRATHKSRAQRKQVAARCGDFDAPTGSEVAAPCGNSEGSATRAPRVDDASKLPQMGVEVAANDDRSCRKSGAKLPQMECEVAAGCGTRVLEGFEGLKQGTVRGPHGRAGLVDFAARSSTCVRPANGAHGTAQNSLAMIRTHPVTRSLDEVLRLRADDLLQVLASYHELPTNATALKRVACALANLAVARCTTAQMRSACIRVHERGSTGCSKALTEAKRAMKPRADDEDIPFAVAYPPPGVLQ